MAGDEATLVCHRGDGRPAFRVLRISAPAELDWRSNHELGKAPRGIELGSTLVHMALSMFESAERARSTAERFGGRLGAFVGQVELAGDAGIWFAETGPPGHYSVWARASELQRHLVAVEAV
jgi:hypothetical protein